MNLLYQIVKLRSWYQWYIYIHNVIIISILLLSEMTLLHGIGRFLRPGYRPSSADLASHPNVEAHGAEERTWSGDEPQLYRGAVCVPSEEPLRLTDSCMGGVEDPIMSSSGVFAWFVNQRVCNKGVNGTSDNVRYSNLIDVDTLCCNLSTHYLEIFRAQK